MSLSVTLQSGLKMPIFGLGTFKIRGMEVVYSVLDAALEAGYRSIDTASVYRNETDIGKCLKDLMPKYDLQRHDIFITSKLEPKDHGHGKCREACLRSIENLDCEYLDLFLIHWPGVQGKKPDDNSNKEMRLASWQDLEELYKEGRLKAIGVSNFEQRHLEELLRECNIKPAVLQIEHHPHLVQHSLVKYCGENDIHFQAYSSLGTTTDNNQLLTDPVVSELAQANGKSPAQVLLRWAVQQGIGVIPKSTNPAHIRNNIDIFDFRLSDNEVARLNSLDTQHHYCWNPSAVS